MTAVFLLRCQNSLWWEISLIVFCVGNGPKKWSKYHLDTLKTTLKFQFANSFKGKLKGPDHRASLEPDELKKLVISIRNIEKAMGSKLKRITKSEQKNIKLIRRSIVAKTKINIGDVFSYDNLTVKRPAYGMSPLKWEELIGKKAKKNFNIDDFIKW